MSYVDKDGLQYFGQEFSDNIDVQIVDSVPVATTSTAGIMTATDKSKLELVDMRPTDAMSINARVSLHNWLYRGKQLSYTKDEILARISSASFEDLYPGDYFTINVTVDNVATDIDLMICALDYYYDATNYNTHHLVVCPKGILSEVAMNTTDTSVGGYLGASTMLAELSDWQTVFENYFGSVHVLARTANLSSAITGSFMDGGSGGNSYQGASSAITATSNVKLQLMSEIQVFGHEVCGNDYDEQQDNKPFGCFQSSNGRNNRAVTNKDWWLKTVGSEEGFVYVDSTKEPKIGGASGVKGVRPFFLIG